MAIITKEQVLKMAQLSHIEVKEDEVQALTNHLEAVLAYAARVQEIAEHVEVPLSKNVNVFRDDVVIKTDSDTILSRAPESEAHYFVVPAILENK